MILQEAAGTGLDNKKSMTSHIVRVKVGTSLLRVILVMISTQTSRIPTHAGDTRGLVGMGTDSAEYVRNHT